MTDAARYFHPRPADHAQLCAMARTAFAETFAHLYDPGPFAEFLDRTCGWHGTMERDLGDPSIRWLVAASGDAIIGYAKFSRLRVPAPDPRPGAVELQQIYVLRPWQGQGVANRLMIWALEEALAQAAPEIYLTVFDHNQRAKGFYTRHGFAEVGALYV